MKFWNNPQATFYPIFLKDWKEIPDSRPLGLEIRDLGNPHCNFRSMWLAVKRAYAGHIATTNESHMNTFVT